MPNLARARDPGSVPRKPPASEQYNWITQKYEAEPEQLELLAFVPDQAILPDDGTVSLLTTANGSQLLVAGFGLYLGKKSERVVVRKGGAICAQVPLLKLQEILVASRGVSVSSDLIEEACARGIRIGFVAQTGKPVALLTSPLITASVETRRAQFAAARSPAGVELARWVVAGKLRNQEKLLRYFARTRTGERRAALEKAAAALRALRRNALAVEAVEIAAARPALLGLEGVGGRLYWGRIAELLPETLRFEGRVHQGPPDAVNAALNYGYGILTTHVWGAVMNAGLEPFAGFLHTDRSGKPSLVLDLVEEFRQPVVDRALFTWLNKNGRLGCENGMLDGPSREAVAERVMRRLNATERHRGQDHQVRSIVQMQARLAASALRGLRKYRPFSFQW